MWYSLGLVLFTFSIIFVSINCVSAEESFVEILSHLSLETILNTASLKTINNKKCIDHLHLFKDKLQTEYWAMQMFDASTKVPESVLMGLLTHLGNFDECIGIENVDTQFGLLSGQHCLASISLAPSVSMKYRDSTDRQNESLQMTDHSANRKAGGIFTNGVDLRLSYCIPSSCSAEEFQTMFNHNLSNVSNKINITVRVPQEMCQTSEGKKLALEDWIAVGIIATIGMLAIMSTAYDLLKTESKTKILTAFSWYINGKKLLSTETSGETLQAIHGIRFLSICWVVMGHRYSGFFSVPAINASSFLELIPNFWRIYLTNGTLAVDTFFYLSGLLVSYIFLKEMNKKNSSFNIFSYYFHRYIRLTPPYAMMMLLTATLLRYAGSGPLYYAGASASAKICQQYWWKSILYINNYIEIEKMCVGQGWYLAIDMQLFILSPVILYPLWKWRKTRSLTFLGALIVGGLVTAFTVCFVERFPAGVFMGNNEIHRLQYYPTHTRFTPWLIGVAFGFLFHETKRKNIKLPKVIVFLGWCLATTALLGSLLGIYPFNRRLYDSGTILNSVLLPEDFFPRFESSIYIAPSRSSWALGVGWVSYACVFGYGGPVNTFLSWSVFQPLSRLTYCVYLVHLSYQSARMMSARTPGYISDLNMIPDSISDMVASLFFAAILSLCIESPIIILEKSLLGGGRSNKKEKLLTSEAIDSQIIFTVENKILLLE